MTGCSSPSTSTEDPVRRRVPVSKKLSTKTEYEFPYSDCTGSPYAEYSVLATYTPQPRPPPIHSGNDNAS